MKNVDIKSRTKIFKGFFSVEELELAFDQNSVPVKRNLVSTHFSCGILVHNISTNSIILVRQYRLGGIDHLNPYVIEIPAGIRDASEPAEICAAREVLEETGYKVNGLEKIGAFFLSPGYSNEKIDLFYAQVTNDQKINQGGGMEAEHEYIEILELSPETCLKMISDGQICDAKTVIAIFWLVRRLAGDVI